MPNVEQPRIRIYFDGAEGTGKTKLARYVRDTYGLPMLEEVARTVASGLTVEDLAHVRADGERSSAFQATVYERQLEEEAKLSPPYVADRTLGNLAYARLYARNFAELVQRVPAPYLQNLRDAVVFVVKPRQELRESAGQDARRLLAGWEGQIRIDESICTLLAMWDVKPMTIDTPHAAEREEIIDWCLAAKGFEKSSLRAIK